ncbi:hypothetical protein CERSUDRAFT_124570 [Gelatoporia subvermispora B]|uniref:Homeobox domain-containing protein n=1 Tax=Ceriporiopsis subvermispora (strain B) TaxID=914234 RepID=M2RCC8_CERS8|nr:hypothetical protein CERSUDRAFT_124570 [Gelatoporia subvermispora B]
MQNTPGGSSKRSQSKSTTPVLGPAAPQPSQPQGTLETEQEGEKRETMRSSPSVSSSQGDMADTEMEAEPSQPSETPAPTPAPKKKRTRTLTTPHQSAVLHALLAQSRFPTTAMREEVGRAIGLSARKVQIWFQNQRQKARRPRGTSVSSVTRPPQYGAFQNAPFDPTLAGPSSGMPYTSHPSPESPLSMRSFGEAFYGGRGPSGARATYPGYQPEQFGHQVGARAGPPTQLSGPGIPGSSGMLEGSYPPPMASAVSPVTMQRSRRSSTSYSMVARDFAPLPSRPSTSGGPSDAYSLRVGVEFPQPGPSRLEPPFTLPPLRIDPLRPAATLPAPATSSRHPSLLPRRSLGQVLPSPAAFDLSHRTPASEPVESPFAHHPTLNIPPPFTLQPRPQWDDPAFSPFSRPSSAVSRPSTSYSGSSSALYSLPSPVRTAGPGSSQPWSSDPLEASGTTPLLPGARPRFDPVRASRADAPHSPALSPSRRRPRSSDDENEGETHAHARRRELPR